MKKCLVILVLLTTFGAAAQSKVGRVVNYYGVDFSGAKVFAAKESNVQFVYTFEAINRLVVSEWAKYNPGRYLGKDIDVEDISVTETRNSAIDPAALTAKSNRFTVTDEAIAEMVKLYQIDENTGEGLVIVCELLDKRDAVGRWAVVYFDVASREVLRIQHRIGKPAGAGLRNFWARSLLEALKQ